MNQSYLHSVLCKMSFKPSPRVSHISFLLPLRKQGLVTSPSYLRISERLRSQLLITAVTQPSSLFTVQLKNNVTNPFLSDTTRGRFIPRVVNLNPVLLLC